MKPYYLIPLLFLSACASTTPKLTLSPLPTPLENTDGIRHPEVLHAYHLGRYADPSDDLIMHEQHVVYRVEENTRWDLRPTTMGSNAWLTPSMPRDAAFAPAPVNDAILAEVNSQRLATTQIMMQARTLSAALGQFQAALQQTKTNFQETALLRVTVNQMQKRLDELAAAQTRPPAPSISTTNEPADSLSP
jgi:hypothetical protein